MFWPCETRTSTCRNFATISSGLYRFLAITVLLDVKDIPQVGPLQWGWINLPLRRLHQHCRGNPASDGAIMIHFQYARANDVVDAVRQIAGDPNAKFVAGGTNLIDLMKMDVERPTKVVDITRLTLKQVEDTPGGGLRIGALVRNSDLAYHPLVEERYPVLASAIMAGASHCAIWHRRVATSCNARAATTSTTQRRPATNTSRAAAAPPSAATIACMRSSAAVMPASRRGARDVGGEGPFLRRAKRSLLTIRCCNQTTDNTLQDIELMPQCQISAFNRRRDLKQSQKEVNCNHTAIMF
jgi:FAD binding domain in molybdopterin dehydrogenase